MIAVSLMMGAATTPARAEEPKNEISVAWGGLSNSQFANIFADIFTAAFEALVNKDGTRWDDTVDFGSLSVEYFHHVTPMISLGGIGVFNVHNRDLLQNGAKIGSNNRSFITMMPAVKFHWVRKDFWGLYSKLAAGASLIVLTEKANATASSDPIDSSDTSAAFNFQASALGLEFGRAFRGFCEGGFGEQGMFALGLRYRF